MKGLLIAFLALNQLIYCSTPVESEETSPIANHKPLQRPKLMLYYSPTCPYSIKVLDYLKAIQMTVPMKNVYATPENKEELRVFGGKMQVPCLIVDGVPIYEAEDINIWLSNHKERLTPK